MRGIISEGCRLQRGFLLLFLLGFLLKSTSAAPNLKTKVSSGEEVLVITTDATEVLADVEGTTSRDGPAESWEGDDSVSNDVDEKARKYTITKKTEAPYKSVKPEIYSFRIQSDIKYRYSRTLVTSRVVNGDLKKSQEVTFRVVLPETAFISKFLMEIDGKSYEAYVKEKEEAKRVYNEAQSQGQTAGLVELSTRNSNIFNVNVNIKPQSKVTFNLTYEELLTRRLGRYEQTINISPEQVTSVKDFQIVVNIVESQNLTQLRVPSLRNDVETSENADGNNKDAIIERPAGNRANITWRPSVKDQEGLSQQGLSGKFVVQYDVDRESNSGEVLVMEGYFVHFFAPEKLQPLRKHVVFILDISGSMWGRKMDQLKDSQKRILDDLSSEDFFNIITFSSDVHLWSPSDPLQQTLPNDYWSSHGERISGILNDPKRQQPFPATKDNIAKAKKFIDSLVANGGTNIHDSIITALNLTSAIKDARDGIVRNPSDDVQYEPLPTALPLEDATTILPESGNTENPTSETPSETTPSDKIVLPKNVESLIIFLTDGEPTIGITDPPYIQKLIQAANRNLTIPIFSLGFGEGADFPFLRKLSLQNYGFGRKIYEASDAALQLKGFYNEIASPLLSNVIFNYTSPEYNVTDLTITSFPTVFGGTEIAVAGRLTPVIPGSQEFVDEVTEQATETLNDGEETTVDLVQVESVTESVPEGVVFDDSRAPVKDFIEKDLVIADKQYLDVSIIGSGRGGIIDFDSPLIFCRPIPWGLPRPYPPRPLPPSSEEDQFLERLWAYLTIQQLIEKDLKEDDASTNEISGSGEEIATSSNNPLLPNPIDFNTYNDRYKLSSRNLTSKTVQVKETPKQQAMRLALKYGFVTPFTSLVVVKPNSSDVTNAVSSDAKPEYFADSLAAPQSMAQFAFLKPQHIMAQHKFSALSNRIAASPAAMSGYSHPGVYGIVPLRFTPPTTYRPHYISSGQGSSGHFASVGFFPESLQESEDSGQDNLDYSNSTPLLQSSSLSSFEESTTSQPSLTINDIVWFNSKNLVMRINETDYKISVNQTDATQENLNSECTIKSSGETGQCTHLKDCVLYNFTQNMDVFTDSYFCPIQSSVANDVKFVGACCPSGGGSVRRDP